MVKLKRETAETKIELKLELAGKGSYNVDTGIGFFDHMLELWSRHGFFDLKLEVQGDLEVDAHHTVEDTGIVLGQALDQALDKREGICRYGEVTLPMDEVLLSTVLDVGGRPYYDDNLNFNRQWVGQFPVELVNEFFRALTDRAEINLHFNVLKPGNTHHQIEACFKGFGRALDQALKSEERLKDAPLSTKGSLKEE